MDNPLSKMRMKRADRYQKVAGEYYDLAKAASSPFLQEYFQRTAEDYRVRAQGELRVLEREGAAANGRPET
jgi:hypothetical protein